MKFYHLFTFLLALCDQVYASDTEGGPMELDEVESLSRQSSQQNLQFFAEEIECKLVVKIGDHLYLETFDVYKQLLAEKNRVAILTFEPQQQGKEFYFKTFYHHYLRREIKSIHAEMNKDLPMPLQYQYIVWVQYMDAEVEALMRETRPHDHFCLCIEPSGTFEQSLKSIPGCVNITLYENGVRKDIYTVNQGKLYPEF